MKYLIKDLQKFTGVPATRIRKWQQRFGLFAPSRARNGYNYYSNDDLFRIRYIDEKIKEGYPLRKIISDLPQTAQAETKLFTRNEWKFIGLISDGSYGNLQKQIDAVEKKSGFAQVIRTLSSVTTLVGRAWQSQCLSISDEHAYSRWLTGYVRALTSGLPVKNTDRWLVTCFPGESHELGALLHYALIRRRGYDAKLTGMLPREELLQEIARGNYKRVSISMVLPVRESQAMRLAGILHDRFPETTFFWGGSGCPDSLRKEDAL